MTEFLILMHDDASRDPDPASWGAYLDRLRELGVFDGGSGIGAGDSFRKGGRPAPVSVQITGYIRVRAEDLRDAQSLIQGNPVFEAGGTVEIRALPKI
jgi:hypothetical protein